MEPTETSSTQLRTLMEATSNVLSDQSCSTPSQFEDADDEWRTNEDTFYDGGQWLPPPQGGHSGDTGDGEGTIEERASVLVGHGDGQALLSETGEWTWEQAGVESEGLYEDANSEQIDSGLFERNSVGDGLNANQSADVLNTQEGIDSLSDGQWMDVQDSSGDQTLPDTQNCPQVASLSESYDELENAAVQEGDFMPSETVDGQDLTDVDNSYPEPDDSMALVPYVPPPDSPDSSVSSSSCTSPRPPQNHRPGPNVATAATGIPLHQNPLGIGQTRFVRIHPMHIAAAVAAQRSQAAAMTRMAAAAAIHQQAAAAAVRQQAAVHQQAAAVHQQVAAAAVRHQATAAAAAQQRTRAALMHQQLVRSRYMGAPVLVRQPFVPVPRVAAPMRVRMRLRRSVILSEEVSLHHQ